MQALKDDLRGAALTAYSGAPGAPRAAACSPPWHLGSSSGACPASVCVQSPIPMLGLVGSRDRNLYVSREGDSGCSGHGWVPPPAKKAPCAHPSCEQLVNFWERAQLHWHQPCLVWPSQAALPCKEVPTSVGRWCCGHQNWGWRWEIPSSLHPSPHQLASPGT